MIENIFFFLFLLSSQPNKIMSLVGTYKIDVTLITTYHFFLFFRNIITYLLKLNKKIKIYNVKKLWKH